MPRSATRSRASGSQASHVYCAATPLQQWRTSRSGTSATLATGSAERILLPDATSLLAFMVESLNGVIDGAEIRRDRMQQNLDEGLGLHAASRLLIALIDKGAQRVRRMHWCRPCAAITREERQPLHGMCAATTEITATLSGAGLLALFDHRASTVHAALLVDRLSQLETRG